MMDGILFFWNFVVKLFIGDPFFVLSSFLGVAPNPCSGWYSSFFALSQVFAVALFGLLFAGYRVSCGKRRYLMLFISLLGLCIRGYENFQFIMHETSSVALGVNSAILFAPLVGSIVAALCINCNKIYAQSVTMFSMVFAALLSWALFYRVVVLGQADPYNIEILNWINVGQLSVNWSMYVDVLSVMMLITVNTVSLVVHLYSVGYMSHDSSNPRFFSYLSLFTFFMLLLVVSDNFLQLFCGWEGVGLCSYLLIGFWYKKDSANAASVKAFVVNRVADLAFILGMCFVIFLFGSLNFSDIFANVSSVTAIKFPVLGVGVLDVACLLLFIGCMGKSAQIGLHVWLPDAMEGPTPVSALIHAATMVTAGVFLLVRCSYMFEYVPDVRIIIAVIGGITCFFAATVGLVQNDIKKVIAYSTCSQLGYMFMACGVSAYSAGMFHLVTHAFFKALLFLGAGNVIHSMSDEQDMRNMGGIYKIVPITYTMIWIGSLALCGIVPLAGHYSKDAILESLFMSSNISLFLLGVVVAFLTAFYSMRLIMMVFHGNKKDSEAHKHAHESSGFMIFPLLLLVMGALFSGYAFYSMGIVRGDMGATSFWKDSVFVLSSNNVLYEMHEKLHALSYGNIVIWSPLVVAVLAIVTGFLMYGRYNPCASYVADKLSFIYRFLSNKWYFDKVYTIMVVRSVNSLGNGFKVLERGVVDFVPNAVAGGVSFISVFFVRLQSGFIWHYVGMVFIGILTFLMLICFSIFITK